MKKIHIPKDRLFSLFVAVLLVAGALVPAAEAQTTPRKRVIVTDRLDKPTPTPTPAADASPKPVTHTVSHLRSRIAMTLASPLLRRGQVGVKIVSLDTGQTVYERNAENYFMPASNMKSYTVAAALDRLGPDFRFVTSVYAGSRPDADGAVNGDLIIYGRGDPSISTAFADGDHYRALDALAEKIAAAGVRDVKGSLIGDETYFNTGPLPYGWEWDDLQWYYGAEISPLTINDNAVDLKVLPTSVGVPLNVQVLPNNRLFKIVNRSQTSPRGTKRELRVTKLLGQNVLEISGTMPVDDSGFSGSITVSRPAELFVELLRERLRLKGVTVRGPARAMNLDDRGGRKLEVADYVELARLESPPLSLIAAKTMKPSQNLYTELILRALGEQAGGDGDSGRTSEQKGIAVVQELLRKAGVPADSVVQYDGSGLSRHNLITPNSSAMLYRYMDSARHADIWRGVLTIGGVDGTLGRRFKGTSAENNVRGKTGTLDQVSALTGYVTSKAGERFVFSVLTNNIPDSRLRVSTIDSIVLALAEFEGRTDETAATGDR